LLWNQSGIVSRLPGILQSRACEHNLLYERSKFSAVPFTRPRQLLPLNFYSRCCNVM